MNKHLLVGLALLIVMGAGAYSLRNQDGRSLDGRRVPSEAFDGRNAAFSINGRSVTLAEGLSETAIDNSSAKMLTRYFGNEATGDLNGDGLPDQAFLVTQDPGGSGTFYYVVVALKEGDGYKMTNAFLVGDRIAPQSTEIRSDSRELHVNYADRKNGEPMVTMPTVGKVLLLKVTADGKLEGLMR